MTLLHPEVVMELQTDELERFYCNSMVFAILSCYNVIIRQQPHCLNSYLKKKCTQDKRTQD